MKLTARVRKPLNKALYPLTTKYHDAIPLSEIFGILKDFGLIVIQEDGTPWAGLLCGNEECVNFDLKTTDDQYVENACLAMSWYRMPSGRYEVNCYVA